MSAQCTDANLYSISLQMGGKPLGKFSFWVLKIQLFDINVLQTFMIVGFSVFLTLKWEI